ncbi:MAG: glycosyltransferase [Pseudorhodoplanes sp.]
MQGFDLDASIAACHNFQGSPFRLPMKPPAFFSIVTVARNDAWSLVKTMRSVFEQNFRDFEYIVIDGASKDGSPHLLEFWQSQGLVTRGVSEPDSGVYNAMNKGARMARGEFVCFLNAGDVFASGDVLARAHAALTSRPLDGLLGWGELNEQIWASWAEGEAFKMASLGFCHQAFYIRRSLVLKEPFDERPFKTDSDTLQLGRLYARGARIAILPEVLAVRGGEPGISSDLQRSARSIINTLTEEYSGLSAEVAERILAFRRKCADPETILALMDLPEPRLVRHLARMVLDTLFQRQSTALDAGMCERLVDRSLAILSAEEGGVRDAEHLIFAQARRAELLEDRNVARRDLDRAITKFEAEEEKRIEKVQAAAMVKSETRSSNFIVSLTSFPARLKSVSFAIRSLFEQSCPPREIHLWLGRDEVPNKNWLPRRLRVLEERGLQIHFADRTFHQYDKFLHNAELNAESAFIIVDDDVIYPPRALEHLLDAHIRHPGAVVANRCHKIAIGKDGVIAPYRAWEREVHLPTPSFLLLPTGAGGVLYPPGFLTDPMVTNIEDILAYAPYADDIWLKVCALARSVPTVATPLSHKSDWYHRYTPTMRAGTLMGINIDRGLNDFQLVRCLDWLARARPNWRADLLLEEEVA